MENQDKKKEVIIEAAIKRFAHFGLAKTTMTEIASDLSLSKALLYYYFPDKINLYAAVLEHLVKSIGDDIRHGLVNINTSIDALNFYLTERHNFLKKYSNVFEYIRTTSPEMPPLIASVLEKAKQTEIEQISTAIKKQESLSITAEEAALLLYDAFVGMRSPVFHSNKTFQLDIEVFETLLERQKKLGEIFLKGLAS